MTWKIVPDAATEEHLIHDQDVAGLVRRMKSLPIVRLAKPTIDNRTISPAVQVFVQHPGSETPTEFLAHASQQAALGYKDYEIIHKPSDTTLNGLKAAYLESSFVAEFPGNRSFKTLSRMWAIPRSGMMFVFVISGQPEDLSAITHDTELILSTVHFQSE